MKKMQKSLVALLCLVCVLSTVFVLFACTDKNANDLEKTVTIVIGEGENATVETITTGAKYLFDLLNEMSNREENKIALNGSWEEYGLFVTEVGSLKAEGSNQYICVLTSDAAYKNATEWAVKKEYNGTEMVSSTRGVSSLPLKDGCVYMFALGTF